MIMLSDENDINDYMPIFFKENVNDTSFYKFYKEFKEECQYLLEKDNNVVFLPNTPQMVCSCDKSCINRTLCTYREECLKKLNNLTRKKKLNKIIQ